ncbi:fungal-specific transcription factor domain-containing protein [Lophiotrema nucula]|uniref:Fungal-specific transcription factor domain-containing protein n=1 Tax=Lophiotrema nucula TaxID=690887 RepID=A0A6A5ZE60_9PLEO|nr:fungal-specific transcription factor domain-containing protein [Lophiotrema nucula]
MSTPPGSRKIAIPRLQRPGHTNSLPKDRRRVPRACTACRSHKIKCSGDTPKCKHCATAGRECVYMLPRRDKLKIVTDRCAQMAAFLHELKARVGDEDSARINELLDAVEDDVSELRQPAASNPDTDVEESKASVADEVGIRVPSQAALSVGAVDLLEEDLLRDERARATGFVGKNSEVQWLRSIVQQLDRADESARETLEQSTFFGTIPSRRGAYSFGSLEQVTSFTFYLDSEHVDLDFYIDPYELPPPDTLERLLNCYMATVHDAFPILPRRPFEDNIRKYLLALRNGSAPQLSPKWQAILNLVLAIGAKYSHLTKASWRGDERDHLIYQARARAFGLDEFALTTHPDVPQIQVAGLLAFYYLSVGQISRSWVMIGMALRFAFALGLHVRNEDPSASPSKKEMLIRIWWSLYSLERILSNITGRPSLIVDGSCSVPLPLPCGEDQLPDNAEDMDRLRKAHASTPTATSPAGSVSFPSSSADMSRVAGAIPANPGSFFNAIVQLGLITQNIISSLYSAGTMIRPLEDIQQEIILLGQRIDKWVAALPTEYNFQSKSTGRNPSITYHRERLLLGFSFCSARILLTRPCLDGLGVTIKEQNVPTRFVQQVADVCVEAAKTIIDLLPNQPDPALIYDNGPWWCNVHYLMQAVSVLLLALSQSSSTPQDRAQLSAYVKKLVRWLRSMQDPLAERAYQMAFSTFEAVAERCLIDISDLRSEHAATLPAMAPPGTAFGVSFPLHAESTLQVRYESTELSAADRSEAGPSSYTGYATQEENTYFDHPYFHHVR